MDEGTNKKALWGESPRTPHRVFYKTAGETVSDFSVRSFAMRLLLLAAVLQNIQKKEHGKEDNAYGAYDADGEPIDRGDA